MHRALDETPDTLTIARAITGWRGDSMQTHRADPDLSQRSNNGQGYFAFYHKKPRPRRHAGDVCSASFRGLNFTLPRGQFAFGVVISDDTGRCIWGEAGMTRDDAVSAALDIIKLAAVLVGDGLTEPERQTMREIADMQPAFGRKRAA